MLEKITWWLIVPVIFLVLAIYVLNEYRKGTLKWRLFEF